MIATGTFTLRVTRAERLHDPEYRMHHWDSTSLRFCAAADVPPHERVGDGQHVTLTRAASSLRGEVIFRRPGDERDDEDVVEVLVVHGTAHGAWRSLTCDEDGVSVELGADVLVRTSLAHGQFGSPGGTVPLAEYLRRRRALDAIRDSA